MFFNNSSVVVGYFSAYWFTCFWSVAPWMYGLGPYPKITLVKRYCRAVLESRFSYHRRRSACRSLGSTLIWRKAFCTSPVIHLKLRRFRRRLSKIIGWRGGPTSKQSCIQWWYLRVWLCWAITHYPHLSRFCLVMNDRLVGDVMNDLPNGNFSY